MDHGKVRFRLLVVTIQDNGLVGVAKSREAIIALPTIRADNCPRSHVLFDEVNEVLRAATWQKSKSKSSCVHSTVIE